MMTTILMMMAAVAYAWYFSRSIMTAPGLKELMGGGGDTLRHFRRQMFGSRIRIQGGGGVKEYPKNVFRVQGGLNGVWNPYTITFELTEVWFT